MIHDPIKLHRDKMGGIGTGDASEKRKAGRTRTVLRVVKVQCSEDEGLARLQNISDGGMMLRVKMPIHLRDVLTVHLTDDVSVKAEVVWTSGDQCGVVFDNAIDSEALLAQLAEGARDGSSRAIRLQTDVGGVAYTEAGIHRIRVKDVSQRGLKVEHNSALVEGIRVKIFLPSGVEQRGIVRWSKGEVAGIQLLEPMGLDDLASAKGL